MRPNAAFRGYFNTMAQVERPLSPHLQIYRLPLTAVMSITHRITGIGLGIGTLVLTWWLLAAAMGPEAYATFVAWVPGFWLGKLVLFGFSVAFFVHFCNGIRHLYWDTGRGFLPHESARSDKVVLGCAAVLTVVTWVVAAALMGRA